MYKGKEENIPKISVVIPIYNVEKYLQQCLDSVCKQTLKDIEIICVNDGSTDSSLDIIRKYSQHDERVKVITGQNAGYGVAVNKGLAAATGEYISLIESDDFILPNMYEKLYQVCEESSHVLDFVKSNTIRFYGDGEEGDCSVIPVIQNKNLYNVIINPIDTPEVFNAYMINTTGIYKTSFIKRNKIVLHESPGASYQDNGLWFQLFMHAEKIMFIDEAFYMYRMDREDSSTNCMSYEKAFCIFKEWDYIYNLLNNVGKEMRKKYLPVFLSRCFGSLFYHFTRILDDYKIIYLRRFSEYMHHLKNIGDLDPKFLLPYQEKDLIKIMEDPVTYFYSSCVNRVDRMCGEKIENKINELNKIILLASNAERNNKHTEQKRNVKVSVIIPVYNAQEKLQECLDSVLNQTLADIEVVCIDDGSTDNSMSILLLNMQIDNRITVFKQKNQGAGAARNKAIEIAKGEFIAFMDADDFYPESTTLEKLYQAAKDNGVKICGGNFAIIENGIVKEGIDNGFRDNCYIDYTEYQEDYGYTSYLYDLDMIRNNNIYFPAYKRFQDPPFFVKAMITAKKFYSISDVTYVYRFVPSHVQWNEEKITDLIKGITDCIVLSKEYKLAKLHYRSVMRLESSYASRIVEYSNGNPDIVRLLILAEQNIQTELYNKGAGENRIKTKLKLNIVDKLFGNEEILLELHQHKENEQRLEQEILAIKGGRGYKIMSILSNKLYKPIKSFIKR